MPDDSIWSFSWGILFGGGEKTVRCLLRDKAVADARMSTQAGESQVRLQPACDMQAAETCVQLSNWI